MSVNKNYTIYVSYFFLLLSCYSISIFPLSHVVFENIFFILVPLSIIFFSLNFSFSKPFETPFRGMPLINFFFIVSLFSFLYSSLFYNSDYLSVYAVFKLIAYPCIIMLFMFKLPDRFLLEENYFEQFLNVLIYFAIINSIFAFVLRMLNITVNETYPVHTL